MKFNKTTLSNGLKIITIPMTDNPSVTVLVMVEAGSKYETKEQNGISHFLEHMVFKGTPKRPNATDISRELDSIGSHYNAFTGQEYTGYYVKVNHTKLDNALEIISDLFMNPLFKKEEIEKEKGVIVEEIRMYKDIPQRVVHEIFGEMLFEGQPAGRSVLGTEDNVRSFTQDQIIQYRKNHYVSSATSVVIAGSFDEAKTIKKAEQYFAEVLGSKKQDKIAVIESQSVPAIKVKYKETDQTHLIIGLRTFSINDKRIPTVNVLSTILGGGMSSRLFSRLRDEMGICYYVRSSHNPNTDHGDLTISAGVDNSRVEEAVKEILAQCKKIKDEPVSLAELQKAKDYLSGTTMLELETSEDRAEFCAGQQILKKKIESPEEIIEKINKVTVADVQKLAKEIFVDEGLNMAIVGKFKDGEGFRSYFKL